MTDDGETLVTHGLERASFLLPGKTKHEEAARLEVSRRGTGVVVHVATQLETGVRLLRIGRDDPRGDVEIGRTSRNERETFLEREVAKVAVNRSHALFDAVRSEVFLQEAEAH